MKKSFIASVLLTSTLALAAAGLSEISLMDAGDLDGDLYQAFGKGIVKTIKQKSQVLADNTFVFETPESKSDFKIEIDGVETPAASSVSLKGITKEITAHEIDKLAVLKEETSVSQMTVLRMKNGTVKFFAEKSVSVADYEKVECKGCEDIWARYSYESAIKTPRDAPTGQPNGRTGSGTGLATGKAKVIMDRDSGRSKGFSRISKNDEELITAWMELFKSEPLKEVVIQFEKLSSGMIEELQNSKSVKLIVPIAMEKENRLVSMGFVIKEQGVKLSIDNGTVTVTLTVSEARPMEPRDNRK